MPRHEVILKRVPREKLEGLGHVDMSDQTVAAYRSRWDAQIKCHYCDEMIDTSGLERVWEAWGPDTVITVSYHWSLEPGDPRELPPDFRNLAHDDVSRNDRGNGTSLDTDSD